MHSLRPPARSSFRLSLQRGVALCAAASFTPPFSTPSALVLNPRNINISGRARVRRNRAAGHRGAITMATPGSREKLARYAAKIQGEWSLGPAAALARIVPELGSEKHKGQLGRVGVFGGSEDYTGAPFFASMSALRMGADLAFVFTAEQASPALKAYSPELMVTPVYSADELAGSSEVATAGVAGDGSGDYGDAGSDDSRDHRTLARGIVEKLTSTLPKLHSLLLGPGMGRHPTVRKAAAGVVACARDRGLPVVLDADGIAMVVEDPSTVRGFPLAVLTPNANEFRLLREKMERDEGTAAEGPPPVTGAAGRGTGSQVGPDVVKRLAAYLGGATVVLKGKVDIISDGTRTVTCGVPGGLKRCGGIGDVLSGAMATALAWVYLQKFEGEEAEELRLWAAWWACAVTRHASRLAYEDKGRAMSATAVFENVGGVVEDVAPSPPVDESSWVPLEA